MTNSTPIFVATLSPTRMRWKVQRECVGRMIKCAARQSPAAWANFVPKNTVIETKNPARAHVAFLLHVLTNALDHGVHILADVFNTRG